MPVKELAEAISRRVPCILAWVDPRAWEDPRANGWDYVTAGPLPTQLGLKALIVKAQDKCARDTVRQEIRRSQDG